MPVMKVKDCRVHSAIFLVWNGCVMLMLSKLCHSVRCLRIYNFDAAQIFWNFQMETEPEPEEGNRQREAEPDGGRGGQRKGQRERG